MHWTERDTGSLIGLDVAGAHCHQHCVTERRLKHQSTCEERANSTLPPAGASSTEPNEPEPPPPLDQHCSVVSCESVSFISGWGLPGVGRLGGGVKTSTRKTFFWQPHGAWSRKPLTESYAIMKLMKGVRNTGCNWSPEEHSTEQRSLKYVSEQSEQGKALLLFFLETISALTGGLLITAN